MQIDWQSTMILFYYGNRCFSLLYHPQIYKRHAASQLQQKQKEEEDNRRLEQLKVELEKQAAHDLERVKYREEQFKQKLSEKAEKELEKQKEMEEREDKLEALRETVSSFNKTVHPLSITKQPGGKVTDLSAFFTVLPAQIHNRINLSP